MYDHKIKLDEAKKYNPDLIIRKLKLKNKSKNFFEYELSDEEIINGFLERSSLWLIDYDMKNDSWKQTDVVDLDEVYNKIKMLHKELDEFKNNRS